MILRLVKRDPAWRIAGILAILIGIGLPAWGPTMMRRDSVNALMLIAFTVFGCANFARPHVHATLFEAALPIAGRDLFLARTLSLLGMVWLPLLCGIGVTLAIGNDGSLALMLLGTGAALTPAILLQHAIRVRELTGPPVWSRLAFLVSVAGGAAWYCLPPGVVLSLCGLLSAAVLLGTWTSVPPSFQVAPLAVAEPAAVRTPSAAKPLSKAYFVWWPVLRSAYIGRPIYYFALMVMQGMFGSWFYFFAIFVVQGVSKNRQSTRWLSALPLSYSTRLRIVLLSTVAPLMAGLAIGMFFPFHYDNQMAKGPRQKVETETNVALEFWRYATEGTVPAIRTPWGETVQPALFQVAGVIFYNPYTVPGSGSMQLHDWQMQRATQAVFGEPMSPAEYLAARRAGVLKPRTGGALMRILTLESAGLFALLLVFATELTAWRRFHRLSFSARVIVMSLLFGVPCAAIFGIDTYFQTDVGVSLGQALFHFALLRFTSAVPNSLLAVAAAAAPIVPMCWILTRQFARSEFTGKNRPEER